MYVYTYIYRERGRERDTQRERETHTHNETQTVACLHILSAHTFPRTSTHGERGDESLSTRGHNSIPSFPPVIPSGGVSCSLSLLYHLICASLISPVSDQNIGFVVLQNPKEAGVVVATGLTSWIVVHFGRFLIPDRFSTRQECQTSH